MSSVPGLGQIGTQAYFAFEVFGKVQGVYFRKYTAEKAASLGLLGFVRNTEQGTVTGAAHGTTIACADLYGHRRHDFIQATPFYLRDSYHVPT